MLDACILEVCGPSVTVAVPVNGIPIRMVDDFLLSSVVQNQTFIKHYYGFTEDA